MLLPRKGTGQPQTIELFSLPWIQSPWLKLPRHPGRFDRLLRTPGPSRGPHAETMSTSPSKRKTTTRLRTEGGFPRFEDGFGSGARAASAPGLVTKRNTSVEPNLQVQEVLGEYSTVPFSFSDDTHGGRRHPWGLMCRTILTSCLVWKIFRSHSVYEARNSNGFACDSAKPKTWNKANQS